MLVMAFIQWWYGPGWQDAGRRLMHRVGNTYQTFSIPILIKTLFAPWRRIMTPPGGSMQQKTRALIDNTVSRAVGFTVRLCTLIAGLLTLSVQIISGALWLIIWPLLPVLGPVLIVGGLLL